MQPENAELTVPEKQENFAEFALRITQVLEAIEDEGSEESRLMIEEVLQQELLPQLRKRADAIAYVITSAEMWEQEAERLSGVARRHANAGKRLKEYVLKSMQSAGIPQIKTATSNLRIQGNGGIQPLIITDEELIPPSLKTATIRMSLFDYQNLRGFAAGWLSAHATNPDIQVHNGELRRALENGQSVPGAKLEERGQHLRVQGSAVMLEGK